MAFEISKISSDKTKYSYTILHLNQSVMPFMSDIVRKPPAANKYEALKNRIISAFDETTESKLRKMLRGRELGNEKPSHFLQWMRNLSDEQVSDNILSTIFLEHMPQNVRGILAATNDQDLVQLAAMADKVIEAFNPTNQIMATTTAREQSSVASENFAEEVRQLKGQKKP